MISGWSCLKSEYSERITNLLPLLSVPLYSKFSKKFKFLSSLFSFFISEISIIPLVFYLFGFEKYIKKLEGAQ